MADSINSSNIKTPANTLAGDLKGTLKFSAMFPAFGALTSTIRNKGVANAVSSLEIEKFKKLKIKLKDCNVDTFTRGIKLSESYDIYKDAAKSAKKLSNKLARATKRRDISAWQKFKNLFTKNKVTVESLKESLKDASEAASKNAKRALDIIDQGDVLVKNADGAMVAAKGVAEITAKDTVKGLFKSELKNKFVLAITLAGAIPRIKDEVIPAFKEKGFIAGVKEAVRVIARTGVDFVSNAGFSAVGRAIGTALGSVVPGVGNAIGGMMGDAVGSCISMRLTNKIFDKKEEQNQQVEEIADNQAENAADNAETDANDKISDNTESYESLTGNPVLDERINTALSI